MNKPFKVQCKALFALMLVVPFVKDNGWLQNSNIETNGPNHQSQNEPPDTMGQPKNAVSHSFSVGPPGAAVTAVMRLSTTFITDTSHTGLRLTQPWCSYQAAPANQWAEVHNFTSCIGFCWTLWDLMPLKADETPANPIGRSEMIQQGGKLWIMRWNCLLFVMK